MPGVFVGSVCACGVREKNNVIVFLDMASAISL